MCILSNHQQSPSNISSLQDLYEIRDQRGPCEGDLRSSWMIHTSSFCEGPPCLSLRSKHYTHDHKQTSHLLVLLRDHPCGECNALMLTWASRRCQSQPMSARAIRQVAVGAGFFLEKSTTYKPFSTCPTKATERVFSHKSTTVSF